MIKSFAFLVSLAVVLCASHSTLAQMKSDPTGTWGGTLSTDAGPGGLEITLSRAGAEWQASMKFRLQGQEVAPIVRDLKIHDEDISFAFDLQRNAFKVTGKFSGDKLSGTVEAFNGNTKIGTGTFALTFGGAMPALKQTGGQMADPDFNTKVDKPAYKKSGPKVLFDEAHHNFHTATGRYKPFADLITNDGYQVVSNTQIHETG